MHPRAILARNLRLLRSARGMSQETLAHEAELTRQYVSDLEREMYAASVDALASLAKVLGVTAANLIDESFEAEGAAKTC